MSAVREAANELKAQRLLLDEDVQPYVQRAEASQVGRQGRNKDPAPSPAQ